MLASALSEATPVAAAAIDIDGGSKIPFGSAPKGRPTSLLR